MANSGSVRRRSISPFRIATPARIERLEPRHLLAAGSGLRADYFDNADLTGWTLARTDPQVDFAWGTAAPDPQLGADSFSVRWSGQLQARYSETYTFTTTSDDGVRLWVDGQRLIDHWTSHALAVDSSTLTLVAGRRYDLVLEYYDHSGAAEAKLEWSSPSQVRQVIPAEYLFPARQGGLLRELWTGLSGATLASLTSSPAYPDHPTSSSPYAPAESPSNWGDNYGERLRGYLTAPLTGDYTFYLASDDASALLLSNSSDPAGARAIASVAGYTAARQWTKYPSQQSLTIPLVANQTYYLEALHKEGSQSDNLAIGWTIPGSSTIEVIPSYDLSPLLPTVKLYQLKPGMTEGSDATARIQVVREGTNTASALTVNYTLTGTATSGSDYEALPGSITIPAGATSAEIAIRPLQDTTYEGSETVTVVLQDAPEYTLGSISAQQATAVIQDDDLPAPTPGTLAISATPLTAFNVWGAGTTKQVVSVTGPGFTQALQVATTGTYTNPWEAQALLNNTIALKKGDAMVVEFVARAASGTAKVGLAFQKASSPYTTSFNTPTLTVGTEWTKFQYPFTVAEDYAVNAAQLAFNLAYGVQTIQLGAVKLTRYGQPASMLPTDTVSGWGGVNGAYGGSRIVAVTGQSFTQALEVETTVKPPNVWDLQLLRSVLLPVDQNDSLYLEFYARSATATNATVASFLQKNSSPYTKSGYTQTTVGSNWTLVRVPFPTAETYTATAAAFGFFFGFGVQKVQIGGIKLVKIPAAEPAIAADPLAAFSTPNSAYGTKQTVAVTGQSFTQALQITTTTVPASPGSFVLTQPSTGAMKQGDTVYLELYARSAGTGSAKFSAVVRSTATPTVTSLTSTQTVGTTWTLIRLPFTLAGDYAAGAATLALECGYGPQTLQIAQVRLTDINQAFALDVFPQASNPATYGGRDAASAWRDTAEANIEANRKAPITVNVVDQNGQSADGVNVIIRQKKHAYYFGSAMVGGLLTRATSADAQTYRNIVQQLFNASVLENDLKWQGWIADRQVAIDASNWVVDHGMMLRGHNLIWPSRGAMPSSIWAAYDSKVATDGTAAANTWLRQTILDHIADEAGAIAGLPTQWDVVNEPYANHDAMDVLGNSAMVEWYQAAAAADPNAQLYLNDYGIFNNHVDTNHQANFENWISYLLNNGAPLHAIGEQSHVGGSGLPDLDQLQPIYDRYARFGLPIMITEFDVNTTDEQLQADYLRDYFTFMFSQASTIGIMQWGFWENAHWLPDAALFRSDWSIKPNGQQYEDLVFGDWWSDVRGTTVNGAFSTRVFKGEYEIVVQKGDTRTVQTVVGDAGGNLTVTLDVTPPTVSSVSINAGQTQRSMVKQLAVTFSEPVTLSSGAINVLLSTGAAVPNTAITVTNPPGDQKTYILAFSGSGVIGGSLADGMYDLVVNASGVSDSVSNVMTANFSKRFHRLFGDSDGNKVINALDYARLKQTFGRAPSDPLFNSAFDYEANGLINALDLARFRQRYGMSFSY